MSAMGKGAYEDAGLPGPQHQHTLAGRWRGRHGDKGSWACASSGHDKARLLLKAAAGLSEALGGQAAISQDRPPTRHIRTTGLSPGPARAAPVLGPDSEHSTIWPPLGKMRGGKEVNAGQETVTPPSGCQGPFLGVGRGGGGGG